MAINSAEIDRVDSLESVIPQWEHWTPAKNTEHLSKLTKNSQNDYFTTASGVKETELNAQTKQCSYKCEK